MTNAQINLETAVKALEKGLLNGKAAEFISEIKDYDKGQLKRLTTAQYKFLNSVYKQVKDKVN